MQYWLMKSEPDVRSIDQQKKAFQMLNRFEFEKNCYRYLFLVNKYI